MMSPMAEWIWPRRPAVTVRTAPTEALSSADLDVLRRLFEAAWPDGEFTQLDWEHACGGTHFLVEDEGEIRSHASVVERDLEVGGRCLRAAYVEAVATWPAHERRGYASAAMRAVAGLIRARYPLGALSTGRPSFYERLGWLRWCGPTHVRTEAGIVRTPDDDDAVLLLFTPTSPTVDRSAPIVCDWRPGDVW